MMIYIKCATISRNGYNMQLKLTPKIYFVEYTSSLIDLLYLISFGDAT
jgi:hypothetical protein